MVKKIIISTFAVASLLLIGCAKPQPKYNYSYTNLLQNGDFEEVFNGFFTHWQTDVAGVCTKYPHSGSKHLIGGYKDKSLSHTYQTIDLLAKGYTQKEIDNGLLVVNYGGYQSGYRDQKDSGQIALIFSDANQKTIKTDAMRPYYGPHWVLKQAWTVIPKGTRYITYMFIAKRANFNNNDGYLDDAFIYIGKKNS